MLEAKDQPEREHVTVFIKRRPEGTGWQMYYKDYGHYRWTVDTPEDFQLMERIITALYPLKPLFTLEDCLMLIKEHPEWAELNCRVQQKLVR